MTLIKVCIAIAAACALSACGEPREHKNEARLGIALEPPNLDPTAGDAHFLLGGSLSRLGRHAAAAASYRAAAATVSDLDESTRRELHDGRAVAELVQLCLQLAQGLVESDAAAAR